MTRDEALALPVVVPLQVAGRAWGWSRSRVYDHQAHGDLPFAVVTIGNRYMVTREELLRSLGIDASATSNSVAGSPADIDEARSAEDLAAVTATATEGPRDDHTPLRAV